MINSCKALMAGSMLIGLLMHLSGQSPAINLESLLHTSIPGDQLVYSSYQKTLKTIDSAHIEFRKEYIAASDSAERETINEEARIYLQRTMLAEIVPAWTSTPWTFNGYSRTPRKGSIACGWYVQRVMENLNFKFEKKNTTLPYFAQNWPKTMIEGLGQQDALFFSRKLVSSNLSDTLKTLPEDIYLIGFSMYEGDPGQHVGFLVVSSQDLYIIHSLISVKRESASRNDFYISSSGVYLCKLFSNKAMESWLRDQPLKW